MLVSHKEKLGFLAVDHLGDGDPLLGVSVHIAELADLDILDHQRGDS